MSVARISLVVAALVVAVASSYVLFRALDERSAPPIVIEDAMATLPVVVDVRGAVESAGVYTLPPGARIHDAVVAAGGFAATADLSTVNLARRLRDGEVVSIPDLQVAGSALTPGASDGGTSNEESLSRININTATAKELESLPGVGEVTSARIISYRDQNGPFRSVDDLIHVEGISDRTIDGFRDVVTIGP